MKDWPTSARDIHDLFVGEELGRGSSRVVYQTEHDKNAVIKFEEGAKSFQNVLEWEVWHAVKDGPLAKWFAPCLDISSNGIWLIQRKAEIIPHAQYPEKIPTFFTDTKYKNFGVIGKQFVCFDYGSMHVRTLSYLKKTMRKADWWE